MSNALDALTKAEAALAVAVEAMTVTERFNTGWRLTDALTGIREAMWTLQHPEGFIT